MFGSKKIASPLKLELEKFDTLIGPETLITGDLTLRESIRIDGTVRGHLKIESESPISVVIGETGRIFGDVLAHRVLIAGQVVGDIDAIERLELRSGCMVQGDVKYQTIAIEHGATVQGALCKVAPLQEAGPALGTVQALENR